MFFARFGHQKQQQHQQYSRQQQYDTGSMYGYRTRRIPVKVQSWVHGVLQLYWYCCDHSMRYWGVCYPL